MHLDEHLREVDARERVGLESAVKQAVVLGELPVVAEEAIEPEAEVDRVVLPRRLLDDEVILLALPAVGLTVGEDTEVQVVSGRAVGVIGIAVVEPAVNLDGAVGGAE